MRVGGVWLGAASGALLWAAWPAARVSAQDSSQPFTLAWSAPAGCPDKREVLARAERLVGHPLTQAAGPEPLELAGSIDAPSADGWRLRFSSRAGGAAERVVSARSCEELGDAAALWIALSIDPGYASRRGDGAPADPIPNDGGSESSAAFADAQPSASPPALPPPEPPPPRAPAPAPVPPAVVSPAPPSRWALAAYGAGWLGRLPGVAPGGGVLGSLSRGALELALAASAFPSRHASQGAAGGDLWLGTAQASSGYALWAGALTPFLGLELDYLHGSGTGVQARSGHSFLLAADAGLRARYTLRKPVRLFAQGFVSVPFERPNFNQRQGADITKVYEPGVVGGSLGLGAELELN